MADFDPHAKLLTVRLAYCGPGRAGKTTNLLGLGERFGVLPGRGEGPPTADTDLCLDLLVPSPCFGDDHGVGVGLHLVETAGERPTRGGRLLDHTDGVVFVADSQTDRAAGNLESFRALEEAAAAAGLDFGQLPLVVQYNKRDLGGVVGEDELRRRWEGTGIPVGFAAARFRLGVLETFEALLMRLHVALEASVGLESRWALRQDLFVAGVLGSAAGRRGKRARAARSRA